MKFITNRALHRMGLLKAAPERELPPPPTVTGTITTAASVRIDRIYTDAVRAEFSDGRTLTLVEGDTVILRVPVALS